MNTASAAGAASEASAQGQADTTSIAKSKEGGDVAPPSLSHCPTIANHHHLSPSSQASGLSSTSQQSLDQNIRYLSGKGEYVPDQHSRITQSKGGRLPAVNAHRKHTHTHLRKHIHGFLPGLIEVSRIPLHHQLLPPPLHSLSLHHCSLILTYPTPFLSSCV